VHAERGQAGVERLARLLVEPPHRLGPGQARPIGAIRRERVVNVGHRHDTRAQRDQLAAQPVGVAAAVVPLVVVPYDDRALREELERRDNLSAEDRMAAHHGPLLVAERTGLAQHALRDPDLPQIVQQAGLRDDIGGRGRDAGRERDPPRERRDALGVPPRVDVLGLERVGQAQQALEAGLLQSAIRFAQVDRVLQRLLVRRAQPRLGPLELPLARPRGLVERLEVARVGERLGEAYLAGHTEASGTSPRTSVSSASGEKGLVR
jgi:hypothetical protein